MSRQWILAGKTIWIAAHRRNGKRFVVRGDEKLTAFLELESVIRRIMPVPVMPDTEFFLIDEQMPVLSDCATFNKANRDSLEL